jgi:homoprotocatechuate degradation regulator HpaR
MPASSSRFTHRNLPLLLLQARERIIARFRPLLNEAGLTEQQWRVVRALLEFGPLEPRQIGRICCLSSPSLAGILARMDDLGLVERERMPHDQRRVAVTVTRRGQALAAQLAPQIEATYGALESQIGPERSAQLYRLLDDIAVRLGEPPAGGEVD